MNRHLANTAIALGLLTATAPAAFHLIQIEQVIGSLNGDAQMQAIQLRFVAGGQIFLGPTRVLSFDAAGQNPIVLFDFTSDFEGNNSDFGARILLTTPKFDAGILPFEPGFHSDYTMTNPIPASRLAGGRITFSLDNDISHYWSLGYGNYTGPNDGDGSNDINFGPPTPFALPATGFRGIRYTSPSPFYGSDNNAADYGLTPNPAVVTNNDEQGFNAVPEPAAAGMVMVGSLVLAGLVASRRRHGRA